ncbi:MAG: nickel-type superoxide dismutase maturation protease [Leptolyngbya sp. SIO4C5]|nr:nickel-type superoxide dismutase maturation protease [Leptolyngbya sp. SIO4C5]
MATDLPSSRWQDLLLWCLRRRQRFRVVNYSMQPLLQPGDEVLLDPQAYCHSPPQVGDIVVARHPQRPDLRLIKRVVAASPEGACFLQGDNAAASEDSRAFGRVPASLIMGKVVCRFF